MILVSGRTQEQLKSQRMMYDLPEQALLRKLLSQYLAGCSDADVRYRRSNKRVVLIRGLRFMCSKTYRSIDDDLGMSITSIRGVIRMPDLVASRYVLVPKSSWLVLISSYPLLLFEF